MSSFLSNSSNQSKLQLATVALASAAVTAGAIYGYQQSRHGERLNRLKKSIPNPAGDAEPELQRVCQIPHHPDELSSHWNAHTNGALLAGLPR